MTTVTRDEYSRNLYNVPVGQCNELTSVDEYKYEEKRQHSLICPGEYISKKKLCKISEKRQCAYTFFFVDLPYSTNK